MLRCIQADWGAPDFSRAMAQRQRATDKELDRVDFDRRLGELIRAKAWQLNGCAHCVDMQTKMPGPWGDGAAPPGPGGLAGDPLLLSSGAGGAGLH